MRFAVLLATAFAVASAMPSLAAEPESDAIEIPLEEIWALGMPATASVRELPAAKADENIVESIRVALEPKPDAKQARRGFAVQGRDDDALVQLYNVLVKLVKPIARFTSEKELSLVFFSYQFPQYVHLDSVERKGDSIRISYRFIPHESEETTEHFAIIPVGKLPAGKYNVRVELNPMEKQYTDLGFTPPPPSAVSQIVCRSFQFVVAD